MTDTKLCLVRFVRPADIAGIGMTDKVDVRIDPESKRPFTEGATVTLIAEGRWVRISTRSGETLIPSSNIATARVLFEDRIKAAKAAK